MDDIRNLPIFALDMVIFPGEPLPLHIFEPRYRQMLSDVMADDKSFGIVSIQDAMPAEYGCLVEVIAVNELPDSRSNILCIGIERFRIRRYLDEGTPYHLAEVELFSDDYAEDDTDYEPEEEAELTHVLFHELLSNRQESMPNPLVTDLEEPELPRALTRCLSPLEHCSTPRLPGSSDGSRMTNTVERLKDINQLLRKMIEDERERVPATETRQS
jgi:ATP-dependent Lon protease